jgi:cytochrome c-type biogenesis protein CcmH/NrfG
MEEDFDVLSAAKSTDIAKSHLEVLVQQNLPGGLVLEVLVIIVSIIVIALWLWCKYQRVKMANDKPSLPTL